MGKGWGEKELAEKDNGFCSKMAGEDMTDLVRNQLDELLAKVEAASEPKELDRSAWFTDPLTKCLFGKSATFSDWGKVRDALHSIDAAVALRKNLDFLEGHAITCRDGSCDAEVWWNDGHNLVVGEREDEYEALALCAALLKALIAKETA